MSAYAVICRLCPAHARHVTRSERWASCAFMAAVHVEHAHGLPWSRAERVAWSSVVARDGVRAEPSHVEPSWPSTLAAEHPSAPLPAERAALARVEPARPCQCGAAASDVPGHARCPDCDSRKRQAFAARNEEIQRLYESGLSCDAIAPRVGLTPWTVWNVLRGRGVRLRCPHEAQRLRREREAA